MGESQSADLTELAKRLIAAHASYSGYDDGSQYDEAFLQVQLAVDGSGSLGKVHIGALMLWKRLNLNTRWARALNNMADSSVREITEEAIRLARDESISIPDAARLARQVLLDLPGCRSGHAVASTILTAGAPVRMAVYDVRAVGALEDLDCPHPGNSYFNYMKTVVGLVEEVNQNGLCWRPRDVDKALYVLGSPRREGEH